MGEEPQKGLWEKGFFLSSGGSHQVGWLGCVCVSIRRESRSSPAIRPWRPGRLGAASSHGRSVRMRGGEGAKTRPSGRLEGRRDGGGIRAGPGPEARGPGQAAAGAKLAGSQSPAAAVASLRPARVMGAAESAAAPCGAVLGARGRWGAGRDGALGHA